MATKKSINLWAIALWTLILILALTGAIVGGVLLAKEEQYLLTVLVGITGLGLAVFSLKKIIEQDKAWKITVKNEIKTETDAILAAWTYPPQLWETFVEKNLIYQRKESLKIGLTILVMVAIGLGIGAWNASDDMETFLQISLPILIGLALLVWFVSVYSVNYFRKIYLQLSEGQSKPGVIISTKGIVINDSLLTAFSFFGGKLSAVTVVDKFDLTCIQFSIYMNNGKNSTTKQYHLPLLNEQKEEATRLIEHLQKEHQLAG